MSNPIRAVQIAAAGAVLAGFTQSAVASDACSPRAIKTAADVAVSNGSTYQTRSMFHTKNAAAIEFIDDGSQVIAVEGPYAWTRGADGDALAGASRRSFALGHQFHAFVLYFDEIADNIRPVTDIAFQGETKTGRSGDLPFGGSVIMIDGARDRPTGLRFELPDTPVIDITFHDWRNQKELDLPYHVRIDDGEDVYDYRYTEIDVSEKDLLWFFESLAAPVIDEVQIHRLHRKLLAAHCLGDAGLMAELTAPDITVASRGDLIRSSDEETQERFKSVFERLDYTAYHDLADPIIDVAENGDIGWAGVKVRAVGAEKTSGAPFDDQWAWIMLAEKIDGVWRNAGNASNRKQD